MATTKKTATAATKKSTAAAKAPTVSRKVRDGSPKRPSRLTMAHLEERLDWIEAQIASRDENYPKLVSPKEEESVDANSILESAKELLASAKNVTKRGRVSKVEVDDDEDENSASNDDDDDLIDVTL